MKINKVAVDNHKYLEVLAHIAKPPREIYVIGELPAVRQPTIAIVGTRKPTAYGREVTQRFARELASRGVVVVSGLALGVDALAHQAAIDSGGVTIAILANPLPDIRPSTNRQIGENIIKSGGAILSEHDASSDYVVGKWSFLERNRLVAGIADAILITEASAKSGTLNTAARALEQGKDVFVVPGNITSPASAGCNELLKQGATPATSIDDIMQVIAPEQAGQQALLPLGNNELETSILKQIQLGVRDGEQMQQNLDVTASEISVALTMLELGGSIRPLGANKWTLR
jgi:DNA processing protein